MALADCIAGRQHVGGHLPGLHREVRQTFRSQNMPELLLGEVSTLEGDVGDAAVGEQSVPSDLRRIRVAD